MHIITVLKYEVVCDVYTYQACRGRRYDAGTEVADSVDSVDSAQATNVRRIPVEADILLAYSVVPGKSILGMVLIKKFNRLISENSLQLVY